MHIGQRNVYVVQRACVCVCVCVCGGVICDHACASHSLKVPDLLFLLSFSRNVMCLIPYVHSVTFKKCWSEGKEGNWVESDYKLWSGRQHLCVKKQCVSCDKKLVQCWQYEMQISGCKKTKEWCTVKQWWTRKADNKILCGYWQLDI
jgi:hypothetical protein